MSQWNSVNLGMSKLVPEPRPIVVTANDSNDRHDKPMGNTISPAIKHPNLPSHQQTAPRHPSRAHHQASRKGNPGHKRRERRMKPTSANWAQKSSNSIPPPENASITPRPPRPAQNNGPSHNVPAPTFVPPGPGAKGPPKAPKAMISQSNNHRNPRKGRFNPAQGAKQPPTGPKAGTTPRKIPKGQPGSATRTRAMNHSNNNPRRKKYVPARKLQSRENDSRTASATNNAGPSTPTPQKVGTHKDAQVVKHPKIQFLSRKGKDVYPTNSYGNNIAGLCPQPQSPQLKNNFAPVMHHDRKYSVASSQYTAPRGPSPKQDIAPWERYVSAEVIKDTVIPLEQGHQIHPARLNHFNPDYSTPSPGSVRYLSPCRSGSAGGNNESFKYGDVMSAKAGRIPAASKGRLMIEKIDYKSSISLERLGKEETELTIVTMKSGKEELGTGPKGGDPGVGIFVAPPNISGMLYRNDPIGVENMFSIGRQSRVRSGLGGSDCQDPFEDGGKRKKAANVDGHGTSASSGGNTKERVVIIIDSDEEDEEAEALRNVLREGVMGNQKMQEDQEMQDDQRLQKPEVKIESEEEYNSKDNPGVLHEDVVMGDCVVHPSSIIVHPVPIEQAFASSLSQSPAAESIACSSTEEKHLEGPSYNSDTPMARWKLPPFQYSSSSRRPTVPIQLLDFVIIEHFEQVALVEIFHCINAFEEDSYRLTDSDFNYVLAKSFLKVRSMFMHDPLLDVGHEICEDIVKKELGVLSEHLAVGGS